MEFFSSDIFKYSVAAFLAFIPVIAWIYVLYKKNDRESKSIISVFLLGTLTVLPILGLQWLWVYHPELDIYQYVNTTVSDPILWFIITYMIAGGMEELIKGGVIYYVDFSGIQIKTINNCIKYNLLVGLGFAFSENILYFYSGINNGDFLNLFSVFVFRSIFTVAAHMVFSSIMGYYYGLSKFTDPIVRQAKWEGKKMKLIRWIALRQGTDPRLILPKIKMWTGFIIAMVMHAAYNLSLISGWVWLAVLIVIGGFLYVQFLSSRRAGNLVLAMTGKERKSLMARRDEEVILELLGIFMKERKYKKVEEIAARLLERDPDNRVVKLFLAKAQDQRELSGVLKDILGKFGKG